MEQVFKATQEQYEALNGYRNGNDILSFNKDADGNWVVAIAIAANPAFIDIKPILIHKLERINYNPKTEEE